METKTLLMDPTSSTADRTIFRIPQGTKFLAGKVRLCNFRVLNNSTLPIYFGTQGIYSLILRMTILNLEGSEIDRIAGDGLNMMAIRLLAAENAQQYSINRQLAQNMCDSITCPSLSQLALTEQAGKDNACVLSAYIDISSMLKYLSVARSVIDEGMIVQVEWNAPSMIANGWSFDRYPCLALDEVISNLPADSASVYVFPTIISERLAVPVSETTTDIFQRRLNSYYAQYIQNIYTLVINDPEDADALGALSGGNGYNLAYSVPNEQLRLYIDGRQLIPFGSVNTDAKKLAMLTDFAGTVTLPGVWAAYNGVKGYPLIGKKWGLTNPNTDVLMSGVLSYGCIKIAQFITNDITIEYQGTFEGAPGNFVYLVLLAEVTRTYNKVTGIVGNLQMPPTVNTI